MTSIATCNALVVCAFMACAHGPEGGGGGGGHTGGNTGPIPADVRKTVETTLGPKLGPTAKISSERENGATIYEAAVKTNLELELSDTGKLLTTEIAVPVASLPSAVIAALAGKGTISEAEVMITATGVTFEVEVGNTEIVVDASGKIIQQVQESDEPGDDEDDD